ncbi:hypothetical protein [Microbacterium karelineae]|uniref:hypothetical protein n=1 Tax=Microbacterium karelineae TaxID=2654283 RepID=UPI0012EA10E6|nr:hypothetical protein [Microbacterium karelineae]
MAILVAVVVASPFADSHEFRPTKECSVEETRAGLCDGGGEDHLDIGDDEEYGPPPNPAPQPAPDPGAPAPPVPIGDPGDPQVPGQPDSPPGADDNGGWQCLDPGEVPVGNECATDPPPEPEEPAPEPGSPAVPDIPPIVVEDIASFAPQPTPPVIEPHGIAIMRAPMNVAVSTSTHTVGGELFGLPVWVTFSPEFATIDYGDGTVIDVSASAPTWDELGQEQLTPTATSHTYGQRGLVTVTVDVAYSATVDFGQWGVFPVNGYIVSPGDGVAVRVYEKQSYLVDGTCEEDPTSPGCGSVF